MFAAPMLTVAANHQDDHAAIASRDSIVGAARALVEGTGRDRPLVLAVSGGCDSMVLLHAVDSALTDCAVADRAHVIVATFDHGTGEMATRAADLVASDATRRGFGVRRGRASLPGATEAVWRAARWSFLAGVRPPTGVVATAHTLDDHLETVVMRCLRDAGARGLAGLAADRVGVMRPLMGVRRSVVRAYAAAHGVPFIDDPSNHSRSHLRNRVRHDLLPAIRRVRPDFEDDMIDLADRAAAWRREVEQMALRYVSETPDERGLRVARHELATYDSAALCVLWPAIAARAGITLDRRGTRRLAQFTTQGASGARIQLSGGLEVVRQRDLFVLSRLSTGRPKPREVPLVGIVDIDGWRFSPETSAEHPSYAAEVSKLTSADAGAFRSDRWTCELPADCRLAVRPWRPADRMRWNAAGAARRVKRFLTDAKIAGPSRVGWPVVLADDEIVWIPGVRRSAAAPERSGRPVVRYTCERFERGPRQHS